MTMFWVVAAAMLCLAIGTVLWPLLRSSAHLDPRARAVHQARQAGVLDAAEAEAKLAALGPGIVAQAPARATAAVVGLLMLGTALLLYRHVGEPRALDPVWMNALGAVAGKPGATDAEAGAEQAPALDQAVAGLAERLRQQPDDLEGWMLLGRAYKTLQQFGPAREALTHALRLAPDDSDVLVEYAEAEVLASDSRRFAGAPRERLQRALTSQPNHPRGLWLLGIADYQEGRFAQAAATWDRLLGLIPPESEMRGMLQQRIEEARQQAGTGVEASAAVSPGPAAAASAQREPAAPSSNVSTATASLTVQVDIAPELRERVGASDVLFVFARAAQGPRMPLAIQRLSAASLPATVTLDDSTSMMPSLTLSGMPEVVVGARVSSSGQATPQSGDFETLSEPLPNTRREPIRLVIDRVVP